MSKTTKRSDVRCRITKTDGEVLEFRPLVDANGTFTHDELVGRYESPTKQDQLKRRKGGFWSQAYFVAEYDEGLPRARSRTATFSTPHNVTATLTGPTLPKDSPKAGAQVVVVEARDALTSTSFSHVYGDPVVHLLAAAMEEARQLQQKAQKGDWVNVAVGLLNLVLLIAVLAVKK